MYRLHFRLFTAVLCAMGLSGCYTQLHQYAWQRAKVVDEAWFQPAEAELYQAGDTFYTKAYHGPGRGCYAGYPFHWVMLRGTGMATFCPDEEKAEAVYLPLTKQSAADVQNSLDKGAPYVIRVEICEDSGGDLKQLPDSARLLPVKTFCNLGVTADRTLRNHRMRSRTDAHKYYAYPLGALTAVAVDAPLSIAGTAATVAIGVVSLPIGLTYRLIESCTTQEAESP